MAGIMVAVTTVEVLYYLTKLSFLLINSCPLNRKQQYKMRNWQKNMENNMLLPKKG